MTYNGIEKPLHELLNPSIVVVAHAHACAHTYTYAHTHNILYMYIYTHMITQALTTVRTCNGKRKLGFILLELVSCVDHMCPHTLDYVQYVPYCPLVVVLTVHRYSTGHILALPCTYVQYIHT